MSKATAPRLIGRYSPVVKSNEVVVALDASLVGQIRRYDKLLFAPKLTPRGQLEHEELRGLICAKLSALVSAT